MLKSHARAVSTSVYRVGDAGFVEFCFGFHDFHRELLDSLRPTTGGRALLVPALFSALLFQSSPLVRKARMEGPPLAGRGGLVRVGSSIAVTALNSSRRSSPDCLLPPCDFGDVTVNER